MLAKFDIKITKNEKTDAQVNISTASFTAVSTNGKDYGFNFVVEPEPAISANLYENASHSGWVAFEISKDDTNPLITFGRKYDGTGGVWFKIQ